MAGSIHIEDLVVSRGSFTLTMDRLDIEPREVFAILGETGAGKTVLLEAIAGAYPVDGGAIELDGKNVDTLPVQQRHLGIVYQDYALFPHMSVADNIGYGLKMNDVGPAEAKRRIAELLELFGIEHIADRFPGIISGGESQRCALARALVMKPEILLLDEPFSAVDPATKERLYQTMRAVHRAFDCTIVFVSHDFNEAVKLADRVAIVLGGRLRAVARADELFSQTFDEDVMRFLGRI